MTERIRNSEFNRFQRCRRAHHFGYTLNLAPSPGTHRRMPLSGQRDAGSAAHAGIQVVHEQGSLNAALAAVTSWVDETRSIRLEGELPELSKADDPEWWKVDRLARAMVEGYVEWLADTGFDAGFTTLCVEEEFEFVLPNGVVVFGTWDLVGHDSVRGGHVVDDCKTLATFETIHPRNQQLLTYCLAWWRLTGEVPVGAGHRQLRRVLRSGNAKPPFYDYSPLHINERILAAHEKQLMARSVDIITARAYDVDSHNLYPNPTRDCSWDCDFKSVCPMVDDGDDVEEAISRLFVTKTGLNE